jgi:hypothetical protein
MADGMGSVPWTGGNIEGVEGLWHSETRGYRSSLANINLPACT